MSKQTLAVVALATTVSTLGILPLCGCRASMAVRDSEMPQAAVGAVSGEYVLEKFVAQDCGIGEAELRTALQKDSALQAVFKGRAEDKDALPVTITVERTTKDVNGGIATVNNLVALCTLSLWPCVDSKELEYTLTASSIVGTRNISFKVMNRSWFGLSPVAMLPVPGLGDIRGDESAIRQFYVTQITDAAKALCSELPKDYAAFKKEQPKYLEEISQAHSEAAFAAFRAANEANAKVDALSKVVNAAVIAKHQDEFIAAFKAESDKAVRTAIWAKLNDDSFAKHQDELVAVFKAEPDKSVRIAILTKLNDGSFDKLPYDPMLIPHWTKLGDSRLLARVYRDGYDKLSEADRKSVIAKITDDVVLTEMVTPPSRDELRAAQRKSKEKMREKMKLGERKLGEMNREELREEMRREAESALDEGLYVKNVDARVAIYRVMKPKAVKALADATLTAHRLEDSLSSLAPVADMSVAVADKSVATEIAIALASKVDSCRQKCKRSWGYRWTDEDEKQWGELKEKIAPVLTDDVVVAKIKADPGLWSVLSGLISDKAKASSLACGFIVDAAKTGKDGEVKKAWDMYGGGISDDDLLMKLSVGVPPLRRAAFVKIQDEAVKEKTLAAMKDALTADLKKCAERQGRMAALIAGIGNGEDLVEWIRGKSGQTELQRKQTFNQLKGRTVVLKGDVREIGKAVFSKNLFVSLTVGKISLFEKMNVRFNIPDKLTPAVSSWQKGETYVMRGEVTSTGGFVDDVNTENAEIVKTEDYEAAMELKAEMDSIKWQLKEIDEKKMPPESVTPSKFGGAVKKAAGWIKSGLDDIKVSGDDLNEAAEMLMGL